MTQASALPHLRAPRAIHFPSEALAPETKVHFKLRTALYAILELALARRARLGSDQFVYWNARDPKRCVAPDVFVRLGEPDCNFASWKTWEFGTPDLAIEILSEDEDWDEKLDRYHELGIKELVSFDPSTERIRVWDRIADDLVERDVSKENTPCITLGGFWVVASLEGLRGLRLSRDRAGDALLPTPTEAESRRAHAQTLRAERRIKELEAALKRTKRKKK